MNTVPVLATDGGKPIARKINFTRESLARVTCPVGRTIVTVYDTKSPGLTYVVRATGARAFYWYGRVKGQVSPVRHHIGGDE